MGGKPSQKAVSKISSASSPAVTVSSPKSSVLKSSFAPSHLQLHLFASVIQSFDSHRLRVHDTTAGLLRSQHETKAGSAITCLDWGYYGAAYRAQRLSLSKKKRKRGQNNLDGAVIAYGTDAGDICMFSPAEGRVVGTLHGGHERGIQAFKFCPSNYLEAWSIGEDAKLVQWNLANDHQTRTIALPDPTIRYLASPSQISPQILCASSTPFAVSLNPTDEFQIDRYDSFKNVVHALFRSEKDSELFLAADSDRYVNVYNIPQKKLVRTLVTGSGVVDADLSNGPEDTSDTLRQEMLCIVTKEGLVELFLQPFAQPKQVNGELTSSKRNLTKKASATVRLISQESRSKQIPIVAASLQGPDLVIVSVDGSVDLVFQKIRWQDEGNGELLFDGTKEVVKVKRASTLNTATLNGVKSVTRSNADESKTVVVNGGAGGGPQVDAIEISSSESEEEDDDEDAEEDTPNQAIEKNEEAEDVDDGDISVADGDEDMVDAHAPPKEDMEVDDEEDGDATEPSFGELLSSKHPHEISIASAFQADASSTALTLKPGHGIPSGMSLGTVLTQALRTNDTSLLEACLHTLDITIVKNTIQRLDSSLAGILLSKLAERLASRPGRYGHLITWVQWTCIAHGGAIVMLPDVASNLHTLYQVLTQRHKTLDQLLLLKGKLDMLDAQLSYRKEAAAQLRPNGLRDGQDEPGMIYIEGKDNWDSEEDEDEDEDLDEDSARPSKRPRAGRKSLEDLVGDDEDEDSEDLMAGANGIEDYSSGEEEDEDDDEGVGLDGQRRSLLDAEAEVSSAEESDPDDAGGPAALEDGSSDVTSSGSEDDDSDNEEGDDDEEEDSEMDSFINDGSIDMDDADEEEVHVPGDSSGSEPDDNDNDEPAPIPAAKAKPKSNDKGKAKEPKRPKHEPKVIKAAKKTKRS